MAVETMVSQNPNLGARVVIRAYEGGGDVENAWAVLLDWGAERNPSRALVLLAEEAGSMERARRILILSGIPVPPSKEAADA